MTSKSNIDRTLDWVLGTIFVAALILVLLVIIGTHVDATNFALECAYDGKVAVQAATGGYVCVTP